MMKKRWISLLLILVLVMAAGCGKKNTTKKVKTEDLDEATLQGMAKDITKDMSLKNKIGQLFMVSIYQLDEAESKNQTKITDAMKKTLKKFAAVGLSLTSVMGLVACGSNSGNQDATKATVDWANVQKPEQFTVMVDGTVVKETNGAQEFYKYLGDLTGLDIKWIRPEHSSYYDSVKNAFASGDIPDVVLLSSTDISGI